MSEDQPKIFVDESWKSQVQREKEEAARKAEEEKAAAPAEAPVEGSPEAPEGEEDHQASFTALVGSLATQAMFTLGLISDPNSGKVMVNLDAARYTLDMLAILREKTQGNLNAEEDEGLAQTCDELEQAFAVRVRQFEEQAMHQAGVDVQNLKGE